VNPQTNRVHCFVCDKGTDAIGWLQDRQGLTFSEAVQELAGRYGIPIPEEDPEAAARAQAEHKERQRLLAWRDRQQKEFHQALLDDLNQMGPAAIALRQQRHAPHAPHCRQPGPRAGFLRPHAHRGGTQIPQQRQ
jgi:DNA primase